jgi:hypothetical protein
MRTIMYAIGFLTLLSSCEINMIEPRYDERDRVTGYYDLEEFSDTYHDYTYYEVRITKGSYNDETIYVDNFYGANIRVKAIFRNGKITIPYQVIDGYEVDGTGNLSGSRLSLTYRIKDTYNRGPADFCSARATIGW